MRRAVPLVSLGMGVVLLFGSGGWLAFDSAVKHPASVPLPEQVGGLAMSRQLTGTDATEEFDLMHSEHFPLTSGSVGIYGDNQVAIWVGGAPFKFLAARLVTAMHDKIAEGNSPFTPVRDFQDRGRVVYELLGMGQKHYYFQSQNLVIWLASDPALSDKALQQILEAYP